MNGTGKAKEGYSVLPLPCKNKNKKDSTLLTNGRKNGLSYASLTVNASRLW
ncbi:MAG: hypothetical protein US94_C0028G0009 [Berkelbacteria bacterium GW2011_GWB1_38_5]|uniref:Uncharacterized protein n=2 Tax=Candidatus Berkelbacteria TaxID=1618330 RepID=A0A0G0LGR6_9BACT|nr:MAG: hypothetical protein US94_C0028G0009 [Berkelbacteria bacterium GW2011_GWB1_38_5]KKQ90262.1 MAG: hypothetical protein UT15_C0017G0002 [Berkelbacteria bacterium GW2011_GWA1_39_10]